MWQKNSVVSKTMIQATTFLINIYFDFFHVKCSNEKENIYWDGNSFQERCINFLQVKAIYGTAICRKLKVRIIII